MKKPSSVEVLKQFINTSDPKQIALVGAIALGLLSQEMTTTEFSAFLQDASAQADKEHAEHLENRPLSKEQVINHYQNGRIASIHDVDERTKRLVGHDGRSLGTVDTSGASGITATNLGTQLSALRAGE